MLINLTRIGYLEAQNFDGEEEKRDGKRQRGCDLKRQGKYEVKHEQKTRFNEENSLNDFRVFQIRAEVILKASYNNFLLTCFQKYLLLLKSVFVSPNNSCIDPRSITF